METIKCPVCQSEMNKYLGTYSCCNSMCGLGNRVFYPLEIEALNNHTVQRSELEKLQAKCNELYDMLKRVEWNGYGQSCVFCGWPKPDGHWDKCELAKLLK